MKHRTKRMLATSCVTAALAAVIPAWGADDVTGAGASFPAPLYTKWAARYHAATGNRINYQSVGSSAGLKQIEARTVDFGASDAPLTDTELQNKELVQFPTVVGGIVPVVNLTGIKPGALRLTGQVLSDIYLGKITRWNDPALTALNPDLALPDEAIAVVRRADGSGTSFAFTHYLGSVSAEWKERVGTGTAVNWPVGLGGKGNEGVAAFVKQLAGAIGYVEFAYAHRNGLSHAQLQNGAGRFVQPSQASFKAAAAGADWGKSFHQILTSQPGDDAWPITSATFILMRQKQDKPAQAVASLAFFSWAYEKGDAEAIDLDYVPMPPEVKRIIIDSWRKIVDSTGKPVSGQ